METIATPWMWAGFFAFVIAATAIAVVWFTCVVALGVLDRFTS